MTNTPNYVFTVRSPLGETVGSVVVTSTHDIWIAAERAEARARVVFRQYGAVTVVLR